jgi:hypothetical protein
MRHMRSVSSVSRILFSVMTSESTRRPCGWICTVSTLPVSLQFSATICLQRSICARNLVFIGFKTMHIAHFVILGLNGSLCKRRLALWGRCLPYFVTFLLQFPLYKESLKFMRCITSAPSGSLSACEEFLAGVSCPVSLGAVEVCILLTRVFADRVTIEPFSSLQFAVLHANVFDASQACTFGLTGKDQRWCFDVCKVCRQLQSIRYHALLIVPIQVWMIPSHCLSALSSPPAVLGPHPLVPMKYQQLATKVKNPPHACDAFTSDVVFQVFTFQANSKWISGFNVRFTFSVPRIDSHDHFILCLLLRWLANFGRFIQSITSNRRWKYRWTYAFSNVWFLDKVSHASSCVHVTTATRLLCDTVHVSSVKISRS